MQTTIDINDEQLATARRLARLGGAFPEFKAAPRRRSESIVVDEEPSEKPFFLVNLKRWREAQLDLG